MSSKQIGLIGVGNMGTALLTGILNSEVEKKDKMIIYDVDELLLNKRGKEFNVEIAKNNEQLVQESKYILIAVKPQVMDSVLEEIGSLIDEQHIIISIVAGISIAHIQKFIKNKIGIVRAMPNTPALVGAGATAMANNGNLNENDLA